MRAGFGKSGAGCFSSCLPAAPLPNRSSFKKGIMISWLVSDAKSMLISSLARRSEVTGAGASKRKLAPGEGLELAVGVRPYPSEWERHLVLPGDWRVFVRPLRPDDDVLDRDLLAHVSKEDLRLRFFDSIKEFSSQFIARLTQLDYARAMAFIAIDEASHEPLGVVRLHIGESREAGEYAILLRSDLKGRGLGWALMQLIIEYAKSEGLKRVDGQILQENHVMLKMCRELGFEVKRNAVERGVYDVTLALKSA